MANEWAQYITALVALYGAMLSTYNLYQQRRKERPDLKITYAIEKCDKIEGIDQYCDPIKKPNVLTIVFSILNKGQRAVMLEKFELWIKNAEIIEVPEVHHGYHHNGIFNYLEDFFPLPYDLQPDRKYNLRIHVEDIAKVLHEKGYLNKVELVGHFMDQAGNSYKSPSYWLDLNECHEHLN